MSFKTIIRKCITTILTLAIMIGVLTQLPQTSVEAASGTWSGGHVYKNAYWLRVDWSESAQNPKTNTSTVTATVYLVQKANYPLSIGGYKPVTIKIGDNTFTTKTTTAIKNSGGVTTKLASHTVNVTHNANGSLNIPISASYDIAATLGGTYFKTMSTSSTAVLDTLDRALPTVTPSVSNITATSVTFKGITNSASDSWAYSKDGGTTWVAFGTTGTTNSVTINGLTANTVYNFKVRARKTINNLMGTSGNLSVTTAPASATWIKAEKQTLASARLTWSAISGAASYNVYKNGILIASGVKTPWYVFDGLISGVENTFSVSATNSVGTTGVQSLVKFMLEPSGDPSNLKISGSSLSSMTLEWSSVPGAATYSVLKNNKVISSGLKVTTFTFTGLKPGESATYGVRAENAGGMSGVTSVDFTVPPKESPTGLGITEETDAQTTLSWNPVEGAESYSVYLDGKLIAENISNPFFNYKNLQGATVHEFGIRAVNKGGISPISTLEHTTFIQIPSNLKITSQTKHEVALTWRKQGAKIKHYNIYRDGLKIGESTTSSFVDVTYKNSLSSYNVSAVDLENIETELSLAVVVQDKEGPEITLSSHKTTASSVMLKGSFEDALSGIDETSYKWAYGDHPTDYFKESGNIFDGHFLTLTRNGLITVYAKDKAGNASVSTFDVTGIVIQKVVGGFEHSEIDFSIDAPGIPMEFSRFYNSTNTANGPLGKGWRLNLTGSLELKENYVFVTLHQGNPLVFEDENGTFVGANTYATLSRSGTKWLLKDAYYTYTFNSDGFLVRIADRNGNLVSIEVSALGYPTKIIDSVGREYIFSYMNDRLTTLTDPIGRKMTYLYTNGVLTGVKSFKGEMIHTYEVDEESRITDIKDVYQTALFTQSYDLQHRLVHQVIDKEILEFSYSLDPYGNQVVNQEDNTIVYDNQGHILKDKEGIKYTYDLNYGNQASKKTSDGVETLYTYDVHGELISQVTKDSKGRVIENTTVNMTYFEDSERIRIRVETNTSTEYTEVDKSTEDVKTVTTTYDDKGNPLTIQEKSKDSDTTMSNTFGSQGKVFSSIDKSGTLTTFTYNAYGYPTKVTIQSQNEEAVETHNTYNMIGLILTLETNRGVKNAFVYDELGNVLRSTSKDGQKETRISRSVYSSKGEKVHEIGSLEYEVSKDLLSPNNHGIATQDVYSDNNVGIQYSYNLKGQLIHTKIGTYQVEKNDTNNLSKVSVGRTSLAQYTYTEDDKALLKTLEYGNGALLSYVYDDRGNRIEFKVNDKLHYTYIYDDENRVVSKKSHVDMMFETSYTYREDGNIEVTILSESKPKYTLLLSKEGTIKRQSFSSGQNYTYTQDEEGLETYSVNEVTFLQKQTQKGKNDRKEKEIISNLSRTILTREYGYDAEGLITQYTNTYKDITFDTYQYEYDGYGNITHVILNNETILNYTYDKGNQLIRVDDKIANETQTFTYDTKGNILEKSVCPYTLGSLVGKAALNTANYEYQNPNFPDQLSSYNGEKLTYDTLGNPLTYRGWAMSWIKGRQLESMVKDKQTLSFFYDDDGIRTTKQLSENEVVQYTTVEGFITSQDESKGSQWVFQYDEDKRLVGFTYNGVEYAYVKNVQEDIIGILDKDGNQLVTYGYDVWGKTTSITGPLASSLGELNPMRYRSYYLDIETGIYYLQSRYYDPEVGRFISADEPGTLSVLTNLDYPLEVNNSYAYSVNNPVNYSDTNGYVVTPANVIGAVVAGIIGAIGGHYLGNWFADSLNINGWKRWAFVKGVTSLVGAAAAAVGWFVGPYISKAWGTWKSRLTGMLRHSYKRISNISSFRMNTHINVSKHAWGKVLSKVTNSGIESLIHQGIRHGVWDLGSGGGIVYIQWRYKGEIIQITGRIIEGIFEISNAFVRTR